MSDIDDDIEPYAGEELEEEEVDLLEKKASQLMSRSALGGDGKRGGGFKKTDLDFGCYHGGGGAEDDEIEEDISIGGQMMSSDQQQSTKAAKGRGLPQILGSQQQQHDKKNASGSHHQRQLSVLTQASSGGGYGGSIGNSGTLTSTGGGGSPSSTYLALKQRSIEIRLQSGIAVSLRVIAPVGKGEDGDIHIAIRTAILDVAAPNGGMASSSNNNSNVNSPQQGITTSTNILSPAPTSASLAVSGFAAKSLSPSTSSMALDATTSSLAPAVFGVKVLPVFESMDHDFTNSFGGNQSQGMAAASHTLDAVRLYRKEITTLTKLRHRNVLGYYGTAKEAEWLYVVMQYCNGGSLSSLVREFGPLPESLVIMFAAQLLDALTYLHQHEVCHRNMTLENLLIDVDENIGTLQVIIGDFGNSVHRHLFAHRREESLTPAYEDDYPAEDEGLGRLMMNGTNNSSSNGGFKNNSSSGHNKGSPLAPMFSNGFSDEGYIDEEDDTADEAHHHQTQQQEQFGVFGKKKGNSSGSPLKNKSIGNSGSSSVHRAPDAAPSPKKAWGVGAGPSGAAATSSTKNFHMDLWCLGCCVIEMLTGEPLPGKCRDEMSAEEPSLKPSTLKTLKDQGVNTAQLKSFLSGCFSIDRDAVTASTLAQHRWVLKSTQSDVVKEALECSYYRSLEAKVGERGAAVKKLAEDEGQQPIDPTKVKVVRDHASMGDASARKSPFRGGRRSGENSARGGSQGTTSFAADDHSSASGPGMGAAAGHVPPLSGRNGGKLPAPTGPQSGGVAGNSQITPRRVVVKI